MEPSYYDCSAPALPFKIKSVAGRDDDPPAVPASEKATILASSSHDLANPYSSSSTSPCSSTTSTCRSSRLVVTRSCHGAPPRLSPHHRQSTMPSDDYDARDFALPLQDTPEARRHCQAPSWSWRTPADGRSQPSSITARLTRRAAKLLRPVVKTLRRLSPIQQAIAILAGLVTFVLTIVFLVYHQRLFNLLVPIAKQWRELPAGWLILWFAIFFVSFPPMIGYSTLLTIAGFVYGFPNSWFIVATATVVGSTCAFIISRSLLKDMVHRLVAKDPRFAALSQTLKHDGIKLLIMIRLCPLPYSLANGAIATFPSVHWVSLATAATIATPKLLLHVFVGAKLGEIAERGGDMDTRTKVISYASIVISGVAGLATGLFIYRKTQARARELQQAELDLDPEQGRDSASRHTRNLSDPDTYSDDPDDVLSFSMTSRSTDSQSSLSDPAHDDISLRQAPAKRGEPLSDGYQDDFSDEEAVHQHALVREESLESGSVSDNREQRAP